MAIVPMQKIRLFVSRGSSAEVLTILQNESFLEFTEITSEIPLQQREKEIFEFNYVSSRLDFAVTFLAPYAAKNGKLKTMIEGDKVQVTEEDISTATFHYTEIIEEIQSLEEKINDSKAKKVALSIEKQILTPWSTYNTPLSAQYQTETTQTLFLQGKPEEFTKLVEILDEENISHEIINVTDTHKTLTIFSEFLSSVDSILRDNSIEIVSLPKRRGTPKEEIDRISRALIKEDTYTSEYETRLRKLATNLPELKIAADQIHWKKQKHDIISTAQQTSDVLVFEGWCPEQELSSVTKKIENQTSVFAIEKIAPADDEVPPVEIKNNALVKPFESVTRLYGLPGHTDIDPTMFLAAFFFLFFGLSLTDVGYGITLTVITGAILTFYKVPKETKPMISLIMLGGIASVMVGLIFGGYFGVDMALLPEWLQSLQKFDPIGNPIPVFYLALACGVAQIVFGLGLSIVRESKNGHFMTGILDSGPWIALFITLGLWGGNLMGYFSGDSKYYVWMIYAVLASLVLTQGRREKSIIGKLGKGILSLYGSINYFSDILSYSRLLALGLATSALAFAINLIAEMVRDVPYVGFALMVVILVVGHLFNLVVNVLGAFIHSARLQFVEFFGKFITGNGRNFKPLQRTERNVVID